MQFHHESELPLVKEVQTANDRTCAVLAVAYLEEKLRDAIEALLVPDKDTRNKLLKPSGPVGSYAAKVELAYLMGIYGKAERGDMLTLGLIRNDFAHLTKLIDFGSRDIRKRCESLVLFGEAFTRLTGIRHDASAKEGARHLFIQTVSALAALLHFQSQNPTPPPLRGIILPPNEPQAGG